MNEYLKGNYKVDVKIEDVEEDADSTDEFERKALSRLGGSICFVSKKTLFWNGDAGAKEETGGAGTKDR